MPVRFYILIFSLCTTFGIKAQDTLFMVNKDKIVCQLKQKDFSGIIYVPYDTVPTKTQKEIIIAKNSVRSITYSNGRWEIVSLKKIRADEINDLFIKGKKDADMNYRHPGGSVGTGITSFLTGGIIGLIPAIACSATTPKAVNLGLPKGALTNNKDYMLGYLYTAKKMKQKKVWHSYLLGVGAAIAFGLILRGV